MAAAGALAMATDNETAANTNSASQADASSASPGSPDPNCSNEAECDENQRKSFSSGKPPHIAEVTVIRNGEIVFQEQFKSGNMTPEEAALGFPRSSLATHTESRAVRSVPLERGDTMVIQGQYRPCPTCKGAMNRVARETGATIVYTWEGLKWVAGGK
jgi:hypothetical protein